MPLQTVITNDKGCAKQIKVRDNQKNPLSRMPPGRNQILNQDSVLEGTPLRYNHLGKVFSMSWRCINQGVRQ